MKLDAQHLRNVVGANFRCAVDMKRANYCGLNLNWNYKLGYIDASMPKCIPKLLKRLNCKLKKSLHYSLHPFNPIAHTKKDTQQMVNNQQYKELLKDQIRHIQST